MARPEISGKKLPGKRARRANPSVIEPAEPNAKAQPTRVPPACFSIATFCAAHHISEAMFFKMREMGIGPAEMRVGTRVLITFEAAAAWRAERERAAATAAE